MQANILANPFIGGAQLNARPPLSGPNLLQQRAQAAPLLNSTGVPGKAIGVGTSPPPNTEQGWVSSIAIPALVSYLGSNRKTSRNQSNPFQLDESVPPDILEIEQGYFIENRGLTFKQKLRFTLLESGKSNPFHSALSLMG